MPPSKARKPRIVLKPRKAHVSPVPDLTPLQFLEGLYLLGPGMEMPVGVYGWVNSFADIIGPDLPRGVWRGSPWIGGDPTVDGFYRRTWDESNCYAVISTFEAENNGDVGRRKHLYVAGFAAMLDDLGTKVPMERGLALPPSYLIETSPGNYQSWLFFDEPIFEREKHEALLDALVKGGLSTDGTDPGMRGVTRYGRAPFGVNSKKKYDPPFPVRLAEWHPERRYSVNEIAKAYGLKLEAAKPKPKPNPPSTPYAGPAPDGHPSAHRAAQFDLLLRCIERLGLYKREQSNGWHHIKCPWAANHSDGRDDGAAISEPGEDNNWKGGFKCHHGHCARHGIDDVHWWVLRELSALVKRDSNSNNNNTGAE